MSIRTTYTQLRENLASLLDEVENNRETIVVERRGHEDIVIVAADEFNSLLETAYLLRSPRNAERLLTALERAKQRIVPPQSLEELRREVGLDDNEA